MITTQTRKEREVWQACELLWESGLTVQQITGDAIAEKLKSLQYAKGSNTYIHLYKRSWLQNKNLNGAEPSVTYNAPPLSNPILLAAKALREEIQAEATAKIAALQSQHQTICESLTQELKTIQANYAELEKVYAQLQSQHITLEQNKACLDKELTAEYQSRLRLEEKLKHQQQLLATLTLAHQQSIEEIKTSYATAEQNLNAQLHNQVNQHQQSFNEFITQQEILRHQWLLEKDNYKQALDKLEKQLHSSKLSEQKLLLEQKHQLQDRQSDKDQISMLQQEIIALVKEKTEVQQLHHKLLDQQAQHHTQTLQKQQIINEYQQECLLLKQSLHQQNLRLSKAQTKMAWLRSLLMKEKIVE